MQTRTANMKIGDYRFHPQYGVGVVREVTNNDIVVEYEHNPHFRTTVALLIASTKSVAPSSYRALIYEDRAGALKLIDEDPVQVMTLVLHDFKGRAKTEEIRDYLAPYFQSRDWSKWWKNTQPLLRRAEYIDTSRAEQREYSLRSEALSEAEESYQRFMRARAKLTPSELYPYAIAVYNAYKGEASLTAEHRSALKAYFERSRNNSELAFDLRLDAILRLDEFGWLADSDRISAIRPLIESGVYLYKLDEYAENRLLEFLLENSNDDLVRKTLLSGLCSSPKAIDEIARWLMKLGDPIWLANGISTMMSEYLPPELVESRYDWLAHRLRKGTHLLDALPSDADWVSLVEQYARMMRVLAAAPHNGIDGKINHNAIAAFSSSLYMRVVPISQELGQAVVVGFSSKEHRAYFTAGLILTLDEIGVTSEFRHVVESALLSTGDLSQDSILELLLDVSKGSPSKRAAELIELLYSHMNANSTLLDHVAIRVVELAQSANQDELLEMIPTLDTLSDLGDARAWSHKIEAFRERAYLRALQDSKVGSSKTFGRLDSSLQVAIREFLNAQLSLANTQIAQLEDVIQEQQGEIGSLETKLAESELKVRELSQGFSRQTSDIQDQEQRRVLLAFVTSLAEFERFAARQPKLAPEADALLRRFNSVLSGQGVSQLEPIGTEIIFDPAACQLADTTPLTTPTRVRVVERGYMIKNRRGENQVLKRCVVQALKES